MKLHSEYVHSGLPVLAFHKLPLACKVTFVPQKLILGKYSLEQAFLSVI